MVRLAAVALTAALAASTRRWAMPSMKLKRLATAVFALCLAGALVSGLLFHLQRDSALGSRRDPSFAYSSRERHHLCVLVPFRDRFEELTEFVPHMARYLTAQNVVPFTLIVLNQVDEFRFNRGALLNAGASYAKERALGCDYFALHDVDLLPTPDAPLSYAFRTHSDNPFHLAPPGLHPKYTYRAFLGGILLVKSAVFVDRLDGFSNKFWGWGLEDDEFRARVLDSGLGVDAPDPETTLAVTRGRPVLKHLHSPRKRKRDFAKCYDQRDATRRRDRSGGLSTLTFELLGERQLRIDGHAATVLNVGLHCDRAATPWCDCTHAPKEEHPLTPLEKRDNIMPNIRDKVELPSANK